MNKKPLNLFLESDTIQKLKHLAVHRGCSVSDLIEEWINKKFKSNKNVGDMFSSLLVGHK